jgi:VWFA-related protein
MRALLIVALSAALLPVLPVSAESRPPAYKIEYDGNVVYKTHDGHLHGTVRYRLSNPDGVKVSEDDEIVIYEDGIEVKRFPMPITKVKVPVEVKKEDVTTVLALDVSASMGFNNKIGEAKKAAGVFLDLLGQRMDTGLILFDHQVALDDLNRFRKPIGDHSKHREQTDLIRRLINQSQPLGGSAYRDATAKAIDMLAYTKGQKAVVLMTDGVDVNSRIKLAEVIKKATTIGVPVYTVGIGNPNLNAVLVLDKSGSMAAPANDFDTTPKIKALHEAGTKFVREMRPGARVALLPFSTEVAVPEPFTSNKDWLINKITSLRPEGGTSLYDATMAGVETLVAANEPGNRVVVVLTDGKDESPGSRFSDQAVIDRAKEVGIKLYMLGLGRKKEINEAVMTRMALQTGGQYFYVGSADQLVQTFQDLSAALNDIEALKELADKTGGKYYPVSDVSKLRDAFKDVAEVVMKEEWKLKDTTDLYEEEFRSARDAQDGTGRKIKIRIENRKDKDAAGRNKSNEATGSGNVRGLVVPAQSPVLYLVLLGCVIGCLALPPGLRMLRRSGNGRA